MAFLEIDQPRQAVPSFMDLTKTKMATEEEVQSALFKLSDLRLKQERLREDEIRTIIMFTSTTPADKYPFVDPVPPSMRNVNMRELSQVDIDWKMLTLARPSTKQEEEVFTRFVELDKLGLKSVAEEEAKGTRIIKPRQGRVLRPPEEPVEDNNDRLEEFTYEYFMRQLVVEDSSNMNDQITLLDDGPEPEPTKKKPAPKKSSPSTTPAPKSADGGKRNLPIISAMHKNRKATVGTKKPVVTQRLSAKKRPSVTISRKVSPRPKSSSTKSTGGGAEKENKKRNANRPQKKQPPAQPEKKSNKGKNINSGSNNNKKGPSKAVKKSGKTAKKKKSKNKGE